MNQLEGLLILTGLPLSLLLTGYWLAALLADSPPVERLAFALPCGLALLLLEVAAVGFFRPLAGPWAWGCLAPAVLTVLLPRSRRQLGRDLAAVARGAPRPVLAAAVLFLGFLLWPVIESPASLFYDGTSNHDSFFWISGAEHLKRHSYMEAPVLSSTQPLTNTASAFCGWKPAWGRVGAEALLALASSVVFASPLKLYLYATASLAVTWAALLTLALRTFVTTTPSRAAAVALVGLQPLFVFFHGNANLPNLLGTLTGTAAIVALERALRAGRARREEFTAWAALAGLSWHGLLCSYPEMVPFVLLPSGLLWLRPWFTQGPRACAGTALLTALAVAAGFAVNPATTLRAAYGFQVSFATARADSSWANLFSPLDLSEYVPALATLSISGAKELDLLGWPLSVLLAGLAVLVVRRSRDRFGLLAGLSGSAVLLAYTLATGFAYGWQKTAQFSGVFVALVFPVAAVEVLWNDPAATAGRRRLVRAVLAVVAVFFAYATVMNCRDGYKWSDRKVISADWFALRERSRTELSRAPVLVEAATFRMAFFHGMWAAYFLPDSRIYYGARGEESGGYLRAWVVNEQTAPIPAPAAVLVGRAWADTLDANSPRLLTGREYALLQKSNRMLAMEGVQPLNGPPDLASNRFSFDLLPHSPSRLVLELAPRSHMGAAVDWDVRRHADGAADFAQTAGGTGPWRVVIPLVPGRRNHIALSNGRAQAAGAPPGFAIRHLRIEDEP
jgi:hypothetical protein